jgi:hypothetical protein
MHNKYIIAYECHDNGPRMWKAVQLGKYFDVSLYSRHFSLLSLTSLLSAPEKEVTSPSDFKLVGALPTVKKNDFKIFLNWLKLDIFRKSSGRSFHKTAAVYLIFFYRRQGSH